MTCGEKYRLHYIEKLRENVISSALLFGSAVDEALNVALQDMKDGKLSEDWQPYYDKFKSYWSEGFINKKKESLSNNIRLVYAQSDMDWDLLSSYEMQELATLANGDPKELHKSVRDQKAIIGWGKVQRARKEFYNYANWLSLRQKGILMLQAYKEKVIPRIVEVLEVQKKLDFQNEEGDAILGYLDAVVKWEDGSILVVDNKTSARDYESDSVKTSAQLSLYRHFMREVYGNNIKAAFFVMKKGMIKDKIKICDTCGHNGSKSRARSCDAEVNGARCPGKWMIDVTAYSDIQIIIDEIPERVENMVLDNFDNVNKMIKTEIFTKNFNSCKGKFGLCPYYNLCWNNSKEGLDSIE